MKKNNHLTHTLRYTCIAALLFFFNSSVLANTQQLSLQQVNAQFEELKKQVESLQIQVISQLPSTKSGNRTKNIRMVKTRKTRRGRR